MRRVAQRARRRPVRRVDQPLGLGRARACVEGVRTASRRRELGGGVVGPCAEQHQMPVEARAARRCGARSSRGESPSARCCGEVALQLLASSRAEGAEPRNRAKCSRSRRYASTVRGARCAASSARKPSSSGSGMRAVVDTAQALSVDVAVDLRGGEGRVPEQLLDRAEVGAAFEQVRRERVAQLVRVRADPPQRARVEPLPARGQEQRSLRAADELGPRVAEIAARSSSAASSPSGTTRSLPPLPCTRTSSCSKSTSARSSETASRERRPAE